MQRHLFISHSKEDAEIAQNICGLLEKKGVRCWIAPRDVLLGTGYAPAIIHAIKNTMGVLLVYSKNANNSGFVAKEIERAISNEKTIFTFRLEDVPPSDDLELFICSSQWIDALDNQLESKLDEVVNAVQHLISKASIQERRPLSSVSTQKKNSLQKQMSSRKRFYPEGLESFEF